MTEAEQKYADIIDLPHHVSPHRPRMSRADRAAQFSPFSALTGYDDAVTETGRLTDTRMTLSEDLKSILNEKLQMIADHIDRAPFVTVTYFVTDKKKTGGAYVDVSGTVKAVNELERTLVLLDGTSIPISSIYAIEGELCGTR